MVSAGQIIWTVFTVLAALIGLGVGYTKTDPIQRLYWVGLMACALVFVVTTMSVDAITEKEDHENVKKLKYFMWVVFLTSAVVYLMAANYFAKDSQHLPTFLLVVAVFLIFPSTLFSVSVASIIGSNL